MQHAWNGPVAWEMRLGVAMCGTYVQGFDTTAVETAREEGKRGAPQHATRETQKYLERRDKNARVLPWSCLAMEKKNRTACPGQLDLAEILEMAGGPLI